MEVSAEKRSHSVRISFIQRKEVFDHESSEDESGFTGWGKLFAVNKSLLTFRIAQFLWYGAGSIPSFFLSIFVKHRGLTLVDISSVFSMIFIFQFLSCCVAGIVADKIGNAKPVTMFLMFSNFAVVVSMLLTPSVNSTFCVQQGKDLSVTNRSQFAENFNSCYRDCLLFNKEHEENYNPNSVFKNKSIFDSFDIEINSSEILCLPFHNSSERTHIHDLQRDCCNACAKNPAARCTSVKDEYIVIVYAFLILAFYSVYNTSYRFMNLTTASLAEKNDSDFGKEQAIARFASFSVLVVVAFVLNIDKSSKSKIDYDPIMGIAAGIMLCGFFALSFTKVPIVAPGRNLLKNAFELIKNVDILAFILLVFVAGNGFAFGFTLRLVYLETLNASSMLVSLHSIAIAFYGISAYLTSKWWLKKFGHNVIFLLCFLSYAVNNFAYSLIFNPWWVLLIDVTVAITHDLFWVAVVMHCWNAAPVGFQATLNAVTGAVHFGIGRSSGVFFGGMLMNYAGPRNAYRVMAAIFLATAILYFIFICIRRRSSPVYAAVNVNENTTATVSKDTDVQEEEAKTTNQKT